MALAITLGLYTNTRPLGYRDAVEIKKSALFLTVKNLWKNAQWSNSVAYAKTALKKHNWHPLPVEYALTALKEDPNSLTYLIGVLSLEKHRQLPNSTLAREVFAKKCIRRYGRDPKNIAQILEEANEVITSHIARTPRGRKSRRLYR